MQLAGTILVVLGAWLTLAVPIALVVGRFLRMGSERAAANATPALPRDSFRSTAA